MPIRTAPPSDRFLERKLGKELCGKLRFPSAPVRNIFVGATLSVAPTFLFGGFHPAGRGGDGCSFLLAQKGTKDAPRGFLHEHLAAGGCSKASPPGPRLRGCVTLVGTIVPAGKDMTMLTSILGPLGPTAIKICRHSYANVHRLVPAYLFGAVGVVSAC